jgi:ligand-binding sensor domain-containing protein
LSGKTVNSVAVDPRNSRILYAATTVSGVVYTSVDSGSNWSTTNIAGGVVNSLSISPANPTQVYAGTAKGVYVRSGTGNWQLLGLSGIKINQIAASPQQMGVLVAGTDQGAYYSTNNGVDWKFVSDEIANLTIRMLQFDPNYPSRVYLGTTSVGTYRFYLP